MRQLMGNQPSSIVRLRRKPTGTKDNVMSNCVRIGIQVPRRLLGSRIGMHPHACKVVSEALSHVLPQCRLQRPAGTGKDAVYAGRC